MFMRKAQPYLAALMAAAVSVPPSLAQESQTQRERDSAWYSRVTDRYTTRGVPPINLSNSGRIEALLRAGRLYLSLRDAVALALENNLDIELQRYGPRLAEADLLRANAGGVVRGIPTGISQGPIRLRVFRRVVEQVPESRARVGRREVVPEPERTEPR